MVTMADSDRSEHEGRNIVAENGRNSAGPARGADGRGTTAPKCLAGPAQADPDPILLEQAVGAGHTVEDRLKQLRAHRGRLEHQQTR